MCFLNMEPTSLAQIPWFSFTTAERGRLSDGWGEAEGRPSPLLPHQFTFKLAAGKEGALVQILFICAFFLFCYFMFFFLWLALKLLHGCGTVPQRGCATEHPPWQCSLCWQELCGRWDLMLFGQANHNYRQKNAFFWGGYSGTVEIRFFFYLPDWQLVLLLMMVGKDVGCYN